MNRPFLHKPHFVVLGWKLSSLGVTAEIAGYSLDANGQFKQQVHRETVKLHDGKQRRKFANEFFTKLKRSEDERSDLSTIRINT
jgi:hypothetical protein